MSYDEVERGLPSVNEVSRGTWRSPRHVPLAHSNLVIITPNDSTTASAVSTPRPNRRHEAPVALLPNQKETESSDEDDGYKESPRPPTQVTQRYIIQDEDDNDMKVIKLDPYATMPNTLEVQKPKPKLTRQNKTSSSNMPLMQVSTSNANGQHSSSNPSTKWIARRAKHFIVFLLTLLPPLFFAITTHYVKFKMAAYGIPVLGLSIFQGILWPSLIFALFNKIWLKLEVFEEVRKGWLELLILPILSSGAILLQIISLINLNITISLAMNFTPLVIVAFIRNIDQEKKFPFVHCLTSLLTYLGMTLIGVSCLYIPFQGDQTTFLIGFGASIGSMMLTILSCILLINLRKKEVDDSITASLCTTLGTVMCVILGLIIGFSPSNGIEVDPGTISSAITFTFFGTIFQYIESKLNPQWEKSQDTTGSGSVKRRTLRGQRYRTLRLSRTRFGVFILSGLWELIKLGINQSGTFYPPSILSVFGLCFVLIGYIATASYDFWLMK